MNILIASDLHGNHDTYSWLVHSATRFQVDALVLGGDLLGAPDTHSDFKEAQKHDAVRVVDSLSRLEVPVFYIMGNDDWVELQPPDDSIQSLHGRRIEFGQYSFVGYQYTLPFMGGVNERPEEQIRIDLTTLTSLIDQHTVFVSHSPAHGIMDVGIFGDSAGSVSIRDMLNSVPFLAHIHGHIHQSFGRVGRHFNVAAGRTRRAMILALDSLEHWVIQ